MASVFGSDPVPRPDDDDEPVGGIQDWSVIEQATESLLGRCVCFESMDDLLEYLESKE